MTSANRVRSFRRTIRLFERILTFYLRDTGGCGGVTLSQCHTLLELEDLGEATVGGMAGRMGLDKSTLSRNVDGLVGIGLIRRAAHPGDRRAVTLTLTDQGRRVCRRLNAFNDRLFGRVLKALPPGEVEGILSGFEALARTFAVTLRMREDACDGPPRPRPRATAQGRARRRGAPRARAARGRR